MARNSLRSILLFTVLSLGLASCATSLKASSGIISRLKNRGPVALSADNPYLAANVLLNKEMESSPDLKGFIEKRGIPSALEVQHESLGALTMQLYYLNERQMYLLEEGDGIWIIRGPEAFSSEKLKQVQNIAAFRYAVGPVPPPIATTTAITPPLPASTPGPAGFQSPSKSPSAGSRTNDDSHLIASLVQGRQKELAEVSPRGDIVHYVTSPQESIPILARWYTLDAGNSGKLARINQFKSDRKLSLGDTIIIPSYLVRNKVRITEEAIRQLAE